MNNILSTSNLIKSKRQSWSLKKILTKARYESNDKIYEVKKCNRPRCKVCSYLREGNEITFNRDKIFKVKANMTCDSKNLIYSIICNGCQKKYIGETTNLRSRVTLHNQHINHTELRQIPLSTHLDNCSRHVPKYQIFPFYKMTNDDRIKRRLKEEHFINIFHPELNKS